MTVDGDDVGGEVVLAAQQRRADAVDVDGGALLLEVADLRGVNERLVRKVRDALDADGFERVKIVVSGGFTVDKIKEFERRQVPVDAYGIGSSLIRGQNDFTADIVMTDGRPSAKVGRRFRPNARLELVP